MYRITKATIDLAENDEGLWLTVKDGAKTATIFLDAEEHGPIVRSTIRAWAHRQFLPKQEPIMQRILAYATGAIALLVVTAATGSAITYVAMNGIQTLSLLGNAALNGIGMAVGGCLGSALVLRFKSARRFIGNFLREIHEKHEGHS